MSLQIQQEIKVDKDNSEKAAEAETARIRQSSVSTNIRQCRVQGSRASCKKLYYALTLWESCILEVITMPTLSTLVKSCSNLMLVQRRISSFHPFIPLHGYFAESPDDAISSRRIKPPRTPFEMYFFPDHSLCPRFVVGAST